MKTCLVIFLLTSYILIEAQAQKSEDELTESVRRLIDNTENSKNDYFSRLNNTLNNAVDKTMEEINNLIGEHTGIIGDYVKSFAEKLANMQRSINQKVVSTVEVPVNASVKAFDNAFLNGLNSTLEMLNQLEQCSSNEEGDNLAKKSLGRIAECVPENSIDQEDIDTLFSHVDQYVEFITKTPSKSLECLNKNVLLIGPCFFSLNVDITAKSLKLGVQMTSDGASISKFYVTGTTQAGICYAAANNNIRKDYKNAGVDVENCL